MQNKKHKPEEIVAKLRQSKLRDKLLNGEIFYSLAEAKVVIESWRHHYNTVRPHSSIGLKTPIKFMKFIGRPNQPTGS